MTISAAATLLRRRAPLHQLPRLAAWSLAGLRVHLRVDSEACPPRVAERARPQNEVEDKRSCGTPAGSTTLYGHSSPALASDVRAAAGARA